MILFSVFLTFTHGFYPNTAVAGTNTTSTTSNDLSPKSIWTFYQWYALLISAASVFFVTWLVSRLVTIARRSIKFSYDQSTDDKNKIYKGSFWDIIRDGDYYPSLPRFQFLLWTVVISFAFLSIYLLRIFGGETGFPAQIPSNVLDLLGISVVVPIAGTAISSYKYDRSLSDKAIRKGDVPRVSTMLLEGNKPVLFRYQMFLWTFIGIGIYLFLFFASFSATIHDVEKAHLCASIKPIQPQFGFLGCANLTNLKTLSGLSLPDVDPSLVILMGLSQGGYLGGKVVARTPIRIDRIVAGATDNTLTIFGDNFGDPSTGGGGMVLIDGVKVPDDKTQRVKWTNTRIEIPLPTGEKLKDGSIVEVITNDSISTTTQYQDRPTVVETDPEDGAIGIPVNLSTISATFSEPMSSATITADTFKLKARNSVTNVAGSPTLKQDGITAVFQLPSTSQLSSGTIYEVTIMRGVRDLAGNSMVTDNIWFFTTA